MVEESAGGWGVCIMRSGGVCSSQWRRKGVHSSLNCVRSEDEAVELGDVSLGFVHQLGADTVGGGGSRVSRRRTKTTISSWLLFTRSLELGPPNTCRANIRYLRYRNPQRTKTGRARQTSFRLNIGNMKQQGLFFLVRKLFCHRHRCISHPFGPDKLMLPQLV